VARPRVPTAQHSSGTVDLDVLATRVSSTTVDELQSAANEIITSSPRKGAVGEAQRDFTRAGVTLWRMANRAVRVGVSLFLMIVLLAVFLWNVDFAEVGQALAGADALLLVAASLVALLSYFIRALRWKFILLPVGRVRLSSVLITTAVGYAALSLLPARMGDLIRPILLARREKIPASASLASVLTERVFDLWTVVFFFLIFIVWPPLMPNLDEGARHSLEVLSLSGYVVGGGLVVGTLILLGLFRYQDRMVEVLTRPVGWIKESWKQPFANFCNHFLDGLRVIQRPRDLFITLVSSVVMWYVVRDLLAGASDPARL